MLVSATDSHNNILISHQKRWSQLNAVGFKQHNIVGCVEATAVAEFFTSTPLTTDPFKSEKHNKAHVT